MSPASTARILVLDQGTTSSRAAVYDENARSLGFSQRELAQSYPQAGWVEHDPEAIWADTLGCAQSVLEQTGTAASAITAIGITNQRETVVVWDRQTGRAIAPALVWQDRRTAELCKELSEAGHEPEVQARTGLLLDPYFSATKLAWILDQVPGARARAEAGELAAGTIDSWLIYRLTGGRRHVTDATNASRTLLCDLESASWQDDLLELFRVPRSLLPEILDCVAEFGRTDRELLGAEIPILGVAGDQQAAAFGQGVRAPGLMKSTYGTGCFTICHTGNRIARSEHRLLSTIATRIVGQNQYAIEGSIFQAGTIIQWLRDELGVLPSAEASEELMAQAKASSEVLLVPAFTGLGAPWWQPNIRGALFGLTRDTGPAELVRAGLEAVAWQTLDLLDATAADCGAPPSVLRVDGGMVRNDSFLQLLADTLQMPVERPSDPESTALGAALLAGMGAGLWTSESELQDCWQSDRVFEPIKEPGPVRRRHAQWLAAVRSLIENPVTADNDAC